MTSALDALQEKTWHAFGVIGTSRQDGRPHAAVGTYIRQDGTFWLPTMGGSVRERNEGPATVVPLAEVPPDVLARAPRYEVWVRLRPERLLSYADDSRR